MQLNAPCWENTDMHTIKEYKCLRTMKVKSAYKTVYLIKDVLYFIFK